MSSLQPSNMCKSRPSATLCGHTEGVTHLDTMQDGIHILSNSKDQTAKLWDIRRAVSSVPRGHAQTSVTGWDYRGSGYPYRHRRLCSPHDTSVMTYSRLALPGRFVFAALAPLTLLLRSHSVNRTLIRCYFSPQATTASRYV